MKKLLVLILTTVIYILSFTSCGNNEPPVVNRDYDEKVVEAAAKQLIMQSLPLNEIYWGDGIDHNEDRNTADGIYYMAVILPDAGFNTLDELRVLTEKTFSKAYTEEIFSSHIFNGSSDTMMCRYYQKYSIIDGTTPEMIMVNTAWKPLIVDEVVYDFDSVKATHSEGEKVMVSISCTVTREGYEPQKRTLEIALIEEEGIGWRIDSPTYLNYDVTTGKK